jgi:SAM-dependent methyltransferase
MFKISEKVQFSKEENKMSSIADIKKARELYYSNKSQNVKFLLDKRFSWMNKFISNDHIGIEVGSGAGFTKDFIKNKNFKLSDLGNGEHLDFKNIDAQNTGFNNESFNFVIASNMIHHIPYPIKFFKEMNRILKKNGRLIIFESYCSVIFQLVTMIMKHEGFDFTLNVWDEDNAKSDEYNAWHGNIAVPHLIFDNKEKFAKNLGKYFNIEYEKLTECLIFLNSGGVTSKTKYIPMSNFFLNILHSIDKLLVKLFPNIFSMGRRIVLTKLN